MKRLTFLIRNYFGFSRSETIGLLFLLLCIWLGLTAAIVYERYAYRTYDYQATDKLLLDSLLRQLEKAQAEMPEKKPVADHPLTREVVFFSFNPNEVSQEQMLSLGFPEWLAKRVAKYREKGGKFRQKADLQKIYGMPEDLYNKLEPYITLPEMRSFKKPANNYSERKAFSGVEKESTDKEKKALFFDINQADSLKLMLLPGIGSKLSSRIIKYRNKLGGFHDMKQLAEVYYINEQALASLNQHTYVGNDFQISKIVLNKVNFKELIAHPYIDYELCKAILKHREVYGEFSSLEDLQEVYLMDSILLEKLRPYLEID
ncbi:MAG: ComEA family DNA-binding protein [Cyclobacteriaceae bacterium]